jgi:hypothetical protein
MNGTGFPGEELSSRSSYPIPAIVCVVMVIAIVGFTGCIGGGGDDSTVSIELGAPQAHQDYLAVEATISGEQNSYNITLEGPDGELADFEIVTQDDISSGQASVWLLMGGYDENPSTGEYEASVRVVGESDDLASGTVVYNGPSLDLGEPGFSWSQAGDHLQLDNVSVSVSNGGQDCFVSEMSVQVGNQTSVCELGSMVSAQVVEHGSNQLVGTGFTLLVDAGSYNATVELMDGSGETLGTVSTTVSVP